MGYSYGNIRRLRPRPAARSGKDPLDLWPDSTEGRPIPVHNRSPYRFEVKYRSSCSNIFGNFSRIIFISAAFTILLFSPWGIEGP